MALCNTIQTLASPLGLVVKNIPATVGIQGFPVSSAGTYVDDSQSFLTLAYSLSFSWFQVLLNIFT